MKKIKLKNQPKWVARCFILAGAVLGGLFAFVSHPIGGTNAQSAGCPDGQRLVTGDVCITNDLDIVIQATATEANQTLTINKYFSNTYTVDWGDENPIEDVTTGITHIYENEGTFNIILSLTGNVSRWRFFDFTKPLVPFSGTTVTGVKITYMPSLAVGFGNSMTAPGNVFFGGFNYNGALTSLPIGSFDTSNITAVGNNFFLNFNSNGALTGLPANSFDTSNIISVGYSFFQNFNQNGALSSLPTGSFVTSNVSGTVGGGFFQNFNQNGALTSLPIGSFDTSKIMMVGSCFFCSFNANGSLTSLPVGSFDTSNITTVNNTFFQNFNQNGALTSLPIGSFNTSNVSGTVGYSFFNNFNASGSLTSLPTGSFDTSNITVVGNNFFAGFNRNGALTSLPIGSFDTSNITAVGNNFFLSFNRNGALTGLPANSFDTSNIISVGYSFFQNFNQNGALTSLPDSFKLTSAAYDGSYSYQYAFNSSNYTLNRNVSDLVSGVTAPSSDRNTFSDNQPGRCGVHANWLASTANACSITYNSNGGNTAIITKRYSSDTTSVVAGNGVAVPTKVGYAFDGWYTDIQTGIKVTTVMFPEMDSGILYAHWNEISKYTVIFDANGGTTNQSLQTVQENTSIRLPKASREGYIFLGWYTDPDGGERVGGYNNSYIVTQDITLYAHWEKYFVVIFDSNGGDQDIPSIYVELNQLISSQTVTKHGYTFDGWYTSDGTKWNFSTDIVQGDMTLYAKWKLCGSGFVVEDNRCIPEGMVLNGVIKVTDGDRTMYLRDRNVGVSSDSVVNYLKIHFIENLNKTLWYTQCDMQCFKPCSGNDDCYNSCYNECYSNKFLEKVEEELGISYENINDAYISSDLGVLEGLLSKKELEAFVLNEKMEMLSNQCGGGIDDTCGGNEILEYINNIFNPSPELQEFNEVSDWLNEYFGEDEFDEFNNKYWDGYYRGLIDGLVNGNFYYRGNNSGVSYTDLKFDPEYWGKIINIGELIAKGFDGGKIGLEGQGWISGNINPCDPDKGEYLPTSDDWKDLLEIWGNANGYVLQGGEDGTYNYEGIDYPVYYYGLDLDSDGWNELNSDLLLPYGYDIGTDMCRNEDAQDNEPCLLFSDNGTYLRSFQDEEGKIGNFNNGGELNYTHFNVRLDAGYRPDNEAAIPVRCFVNPAEVPDVYVVSYETNGGNVIGDVNVIRGDTVILPTPTKDNYKFDGWYTDKQLANKFVSSTPINSDLILYAKWESTITNNGGLSRGAQLKKDYCPDGDCSDSYYDGDCGTNKTEDDNKYNSANEVQYDVSKYNSSYSDEMNQAYQYAYKYGITTKGSIKDADINGKLTRVAMAKMLSQYAINVLGKKPDTTRQKTFSDVSTSLDLKYDNGVTLAYQLGIMGINMPDSRFRPYDYVPRAEFVTVLSRMLYKTPDGEYAGTPKYYTNHMYLLERLGILTNTDPNLVERRGYIMLMLMRSAK